MKQDGEPRGTIASDRPGTIIRVDHEALVRLARDAGVVLEMTRGIGSFVPEGGTIFRYDQPASDLNPDLVRRAVAVGPERTMDQDGAFGVQTLVDIAERSLTDSFNDQTTASQAVDRIHDLLRQLANRPFPSGRFPDTEGIVRLIVPELGWEGYVALAFDQIALVGKDSPAVMERIRDALEDLLTVAPPDRRDPLVVRALAIADEREMESDGSRSRTAGHAVA